MGESIKRLRGTMTPYTANGRDRSALPAQAIRGVRYELRQRDCPRCVHSLHAFDLAPLACRVGGCGLPLGEAEAAQLAAAREPGPDTLSRFYYLNALALRHGALPDEAFEQLIDDARLVRFADKTACYPLCYAPALYRVRDLAALARGLAEPRTYLALDFKGRDAFLASRTGRYR